uniref:Reverse transcriptase domain-containing protein n=1 Tax=Tanacetum cinerariifolium TaxID=118510 RepID=A0A6L2MFC4_TANCI|nr:hypothetical protein [Tanacetum cinerariifolium]
MLRSYCEMMSQRCEQTAQKEQELLEQEQAVEEKQEFLAKEQATNPSEPSPISYFYNADKDNISTLSTTYTIHLTKSATIITNPSEPTRRIYNNHDIFYDGDDDEELFPDEVKRIQQILKKTLFDAITLEFSITNFLRMGDEHLSTYLKTESDEVIKSSVKNFVLILSESEDTSGSASVCILPSYDDLSPIDVPEEKAVTFSNPLFNLNDNLISSDDVELLLHHDPSIPKMSVASILEGFTSEPPLEENDDLFDLKSKNDDYKKILYDAQWDEIDGYEAVWIGRP